MISLIILIVFSQSTLNAENNDELDPEIRDTLIKAKNRIIELDKELKKKNEHLKVAYKRIEDQGKKIDSLYSKLIDTEKLYKKDKSEWLAKERIYLQKMNYLNDSYEKLKKSKYGGNYFDLYLKGGMTNKLNSEFGVFAFMGGEIFLTKKLTIGVELGFYHREPSGNLFLKYIIF